MKHSVFGIFILKIPLYLPQHNLQQNLPLPRFISLAGVLNTLLQFKHSLDTIMLCIMIDLHWCVSQNDPKGSDKGKIMEFLFGCYVAGVICIAVVVFWTTEHDQPKNKFDRISQDVALMLLTLMWPLYFILSLLAFPPYLIRKAIRYIKNHHSRNQNNEWIHGIQSFGLRESDSVV